MQPTTFYLNVLVLMFDRTYKDISKIEKDDVVMGLDGQPNPVMSVIEEEINDITYTINSHSCYFDCRIVFQMNIQGKLPVKIIEPIVKKKLTTQTNIYTKMLDENHLITHKEIVRNIRKIKPEQHELFNTDPKYIDMYQRKVNILVGQDMLDINNQTQLDEIKMDVINRINIDTKMEERINYEFGRSDYNPPNYSLITPKEIVETNAMEKGILKYKVEHYRKYVYPKDLPVPYEPYAFGYWIAKWEYLTEDIKQEIEGNMLSKLELIKIYCNNSVNIRYGVLSGILDGSEVELKETYIKVRSNAEIANANIIILLNSLLTSLDFKYYFNWNNCLIYADKPDKINRLKLIAHPENTIPILKRYDLEVLQIKNMSKHIQITKNSPKQRKMFSFKTANGTEFLTSDNIVLSVE
jgi:hypothetical protein